MSIRILTHVLLAATLVAPAIALAQSSAMHPAQPKAPASPAQIYDKLLSEQEREIEAAAEAMPADKFDFAPPASIGTFTGVRTFSAQVKHIAEANYLFFHTWKIPGGKSRADIEKLATRDDILAALRDSFTYAHAAFATITTDNAFTDLDGKGTTRAGMAAYSMIHNNDHYGQMVEYLRMNNTIPPASRK